MDLVELRAFAAAAESASLTAAARRLRLSQPGLSRCIQRLEAEVGARLLDRDGQGVRLTEAGERFLDFATRTLAGFDRLLDELRGEAGQLRGHIAIVASTTPGEYLVPRLVAEFGESYPQVSHELHVTDSAAVRRDLLERRHDVGFSGCPADDRRLRYLPIAQDEVVLAVPAGHRLAGARAVALEDLAGERLIQREEGSGTQQTLLDALHARGLRLPMRSAPVSLGTTHAVLAAVEAGLGVGLVTLRALDQHASAAVVPLRLAEVPLLRALFMVYEPERARPAHVQAFLSFVEVHEASVLPG